MYLYRTILYKQPAALGLPNNSHAADIADFEASYKAQATRVNEMVLAETTFVVDLSYSAFKEKVDGITVTWADIKYTEDGAKYWLNVLTSNPI